MFNRFFNGEPTDIVTPEVLVEIVGNSLLDEGTDVRSHKVDGKRVVVIDEFAWPDGYNRTEYREQ